MSVAGNIMQRIKEAPPGDGILREVFVHPTQMLKFDNGTTASELIDAAAAGNPNSFLLGTSDDLTVTWQVPIDYDSDPDYEYLQFTWYLANTNASPSSVLTMELDGIATGDTWSTETELSTALSATSFSDWGAQNIVTEASFTVTAGNVSIGQILQHRISMPASADAVRVLGCRIRYRSNICATDTSLRQV